VSALDSYTRSVASLQQAIAEVAHDAAALAGPGAPAAELLELLRLQLHRQIDKVIDEEALRHPSPRRLIARTPRYADLLAEVAGWE